VEVNYMTPWLAPTLQGLGALQGCMYADDCYAMQSSGLATVIHTYETNSLFGGPTEWSALAPSGQYLARLEHARKAIEEQPNYEHGSLTSVVAYLRRSIEREMQLAEIETIEKLVRRGFGYDVQVLASPAFSYPDINLPFQFEAIGDYPIAATAAFPTAAGLTAGVWNFSTFYAEPPLIVTALRAERKRREKRHFFQRLTQARKSVHRTERTFCGISWTKRLWHLLHGSHPPKSEGMAPCQALGCV
jgi:hypothetical protein